MIIIESLTIFPDAEIGGMLADVPNRDSLTECRDMAVGGLSAGTDSGRPSVIIRMTTPNGNVMVGETTLALFLTAADGLKARHGDPRQ